METRDPFRIRDTSAQDNAIKPATSAGRRIPKAWLVGGGAGALVLALAVWVASGWMSGGRSFDASKVRIAEVTRGDLVRDISADGRVIAANSPTLYAIAGGTVVLKVVAGDVVKKGQALAVMEAMKMEHTIAAPVDGVVQELLYAPGDQVTEGAELLRLTVAAKA